MFLLGLVTCYREGVLPQFGVRALLEGCDFVYVLDGPIHVAGTSGEPEGEATDLGKYAKHARVTFQTWRGEPFASDAAKRTHMLRWAQKRFERERPLWGMWLDGDESLLWPEHLKLWFVGSPADAGGMPIPLIELDGTLSVTQSRLIRLDQIERYVLGGYQVKFFGQETVVPLGNVPATEPPNLGLPLITHLAPFRKPKRQEHRVHVGELDWLHGATADWEREAEKAAALRRSLGTPRGSR